MTTMNTRLPQVKAFALAMPRSGRVVQSPGPRCTIPRVVARVAARLSRPARVLGT